MNKKLLLKLVNKLLKADYNEKKIRENVRLLKKLPKIEAIFALSAYLKGLKQQINAHTMVVEGAVKLSKSEMQNIEKKFHSLFIIHHSIFKLNTSLLGGLRVKIGDNLFEDTIQSRIEQVKGAICQI